MNDEVNPADLPLLLRGSVQPGDYLTSNVANRLLYAAADYIESKLADEARTHDAASPSAPVGQEIAYLDLGVGGYIDLGSAMTDEQLAKLPKGRHALGIIGTYGVDGYVAAPPAAQAVDQWQPIETAPKDGTIIIVAGAPEIGYTLPCVVDAFYDEGGWQVNQWESPSFAITPTHWMPIPPIDQQAGGEEVVP